MYMYVVSFNIPTQAEILFYNIVECNTEQKNVRKALIWSEPEQNKPFNLSVCVQRTVNVFIVLLAASVCGRYMYL